MPTPHYGPSPTEDITTRRIRRFVAHGIVKVFVFALSPMLLFRLSQALVLELFLLVMFAIGPDSNIEKPFWLRPTAQGWMSATVCLVTVLLPAAALAIAYDRLANRFCVSRLWSWTSFCLLSFAAASVFCNVHLSDVAGESRICLGRAPTLLGWHTLQGTVPLLLGWWLAIASSFRICPGTIGGTHAQSVDGG